MRIFLLVALAFLTVGVVECESRTHTRPAGIRKHINRRDVDIDKQTAESDESPKKEADDSSINDSDEAVVPMKKESNAVLKKQESVKKLRGEKNKVIPGNPEASEDHIYGNKRHDFHSCSQDSWNFEEWELCPSKTARPMPGSHLVGVGYDSSVGLDEDRLLETIVYTSRQHEKTFCRNIDGTRRQDENEGYGVDDQVLFKKGTGETSYVQSLEKTTISSAKNEDSSSDYHEEAGVESHSSVCVSASIPDIATVSASTTIENKLKIGWGRKEVNSKREAAINGKSVFTEALKTPVYTLILKSMFDDNSCKSQLVINPEIIEALNKLKGQEFNYEWVAFFKKYGTHFIVAVQYGGSFSRTQIVSSHDARSTAQYSNQKTFTHDVVILNVGAKGTSSSGSGSGSSSDSTQSSDRTQVDCVPYCTEPSSMINAALKRPVLMDGGLFTLPLGEATGLESYKDEIYNKSKLFERFTLANPDLDSDGKNDLYGVVEEVKREREEVRKCVDDINEKLPFLILRVSSLKEFLEDIIKLDQEETIPSPQTFEKIWKKLKDFAISVDPYEYKFIDLDTAPKGDCFYLDLGCLAQRAKDWLLGQSEKLQKAVNELFGEVVFKDQMKAKIKVLRKDIYSEIRKIVEEKIKLSSRRISQIKAIQDGSKRCVEDPIEFHKNVFLNYGIKCAVSDADNCKNFACMKKIYCGDKTCNSPLENKCEYMVQHCNDFNGKEDERGWQCKDYSAAMKTGRCDSSPCSQEEVLGMCQTKHLKSNTAVTMEHVCPMACRSERCIQKLKVEDMGEKAGNSPDKPGKENEPCEKKIPGTCVLPSNCPKKRQMPNACLAQNIVCCMSEDASEADKPVLENFSSESEGDF